MKIFITGGTGFIGKHLINKLKKTEHELMLLTIEKEKFPSFYPRNLQTISGNLAEVNKWKKFLHNFNPDTVIHMAWENIPDYSWENSMKNLTYGLDFFKILKNTDCKKIIVTGSCWEYGEKKGCLSEKKIPKSSNPFTAAKNCLNVMGSSLAKESGINFIWTRLFYVYGPFQRSYSLLPHVINNISNGEKPDIKTPDSRNDFIYIEDAVKALKMISEKCEKSEIFNIGSGKPTKVGDIVEIISKKNLYNYNIPVKTNNPDIDFWADISKIKRIIGWKPETTLEEGIDKTVKFFQPQKKGSNGV